MNVFLQTSQELVFLCPCTGAHLGWPQGRRAGTLSWLWPLGEMCWAEFWDWLYLSRCFLKCWIKKFPGNWTRCALNASTPWRMYIWNLVGFSVLWLLFSPESSCKPEQNWCTLTDLRSKWGFVIHNCFFKKRLWQGEFYVCTYSSVPGRREVFMHQLMKSNKAQNLSNTPSNEKFIPLALITVWLRSESIFNSFFCSFI